MLGGPQIVALFIYPLPGVLIFRHFCSVIVTKKISYVGKNRLSPRFFYWAEPSRVVVCPGQFYSPTLSVLMPASKRSESGLLRVRFIERNACLAFKVFSVPELARDNYNRLFLYQKQVMVEKRLRGSALC